MGGWRRGEGKLGRGIRKVWPGLGLEELLFAIILSKGVCEVGVKGEGDGNNCGNSERQLIHFER